MDHDHRELALSAESEARLDRERRRVATLEEDHPLRRPILEALADGWPRHLGVAEFADSDRLSGVPRIEIMTSLVQMEDECVLHSGVVDGETRWSMTRWGRSEYGAHLALGERKPPPPPPTRAEKEAFLEEALDGALFRVLPAHGAEEAAERMRLIAEEARAEHMDTLASRAEAALAGLA